MHYQIPFEDAHRHHSKSVITMTSTLPDRPATRTQCKIAAGQGLFAATDFKKDDFVVGFPGFWVHSQLADAPASALKMKDSYNFTLPDDMGWGSMHKMVYATHKCQANYINAGVIGQEVRTI